MDIAEQAISTYEKTKSMKATAAHLKISNKTVKKILVSAGIYTTDISIKVAALANQGKSQKAIADILGISKAAVCENLPYSRGTYLIKSQSRNAENIRRFRRKKRCAEQSEEID